MNNSVNPVKMLSNGSAFECVCKLCRLLLGAVIAASAQQLPVFEGIAVPQAQGPHHTITGIVVNGISAEPVRRALVQGLSQRQFNVLTGPDGRFQIADVPEGMLNLTAQKPGFFDARSVPALASQDSFQMFKVDSGKNDFKLVLYPYASIVGHIKDQAGEPIGGVPLQVLAEEINSSGRKHWQPRSGAQTEDDGSFEIADLLPGKYLISTTGRAAEGEDENPPVEVFRPAYFPNAPDLASAQVIELRPGQEFRADFSLKSERGYRVNVQLSGSPVPGNAPMILNESGAAIQLVANFDQAHNTWTLSGVPSGNWTLSCFANDPQGHQYHGQIAIAINHADLDRVQLVLYPVLNIPVTVNHASPPAAPAPVLAGGITAIPNQGIAATIEAVNPFETTVFGMQLQSEPGTGAFTWAMPNVMPGKYQLNLQAYGNECVESAWYGSVDVLRDQLVISPGDSPRPLTINMRSDCATLTAKVRAGKKPGLYAVLVVPQAGLGSPYLAMIPSDRPSMAPMPIFGSSAIPVLAPGSYDLYAFSNIENLEYANPQALSGYPAKHISLSAGQQTEIILEPIERKEN